VAIESQAER